MSSGGRTHTAPGTCLPAAELDAAWLRGYFAGFEDCKGKGKQGKGKRAAPDEEPYLSGGGGKKKKQSTGAEQEEWRKKWTELDTEKATEPYFWVLREQERVIYPQEIQLALTDALHRVTQERGQQVEYDMTGGRVYTLRLCAKAVLEKVEGAKAEDAELVGIQVNTATSEVKQDEPLLFVENVPYRLIFLSRPQTP